MPLYLLRTTTNKPSGFNKLLAATKIQLAVLLLLSCSMQFNAASADTLPSRFDAYYNLSKGPITFGKTRRSLKIVDGKQIFESVTEPSGIATLFADGEIIERSTWDLHDGSPRPLEFLYENTSDDKERKVQLLFDWENKEVTNIINGDPWKMSVEAGTLDKLLYQLTIMSDLSKGKTKFDYPIADGGAVKLYNIERQGEEEIETELGRFRTIKLVREEEKRRTTMWCAPKLRYLPIRIEQVKADGSTLDAVLYALENMMGAAQQPIKK